MQFQSIEQYEKWATYVIKRFIVDKKLQKRLLQDTDFLGNIMREMMVADEKYDESRGASIKTYRIQRARWYILKYLDKLKNNLNKHNNIVSINDFNYNGLTAQSVGHVLEDKEYLKLLIENTDLTNTQKECLRLYFVEQKTHAEIGEIFGFTRQASKQNVTNGINKLRATAAERE